jgi:hypothetical protein
VFLYPTPELPDDTPIDHVRFAARIRKVLKAGINIVGEVRKTSDKTLLGLQDLGQSSFTLSPSSLIHVFRFGFKSVGGILNLLSGCHEPPSALEL